MLKFFKDIINKFMSKGNTVYAQYHFDGKLLYDEAEEYNYLIQHLLDHKDEVEVISLVPDLTIILKYKETYYSFSIGNKWYAYLSTVRIGKALNEFSDYSYVTKEKYSLNQIACKPELMFKFYETFELPVEKENSKQTTLVKIKKELENV